MPSASAEEDEPKAASNPALVGAIAGFVGGLVSGAGISLLLT